jgi:hypothetical protein
MEQEGVREEGKNEVKGGMARRKKQSRGRQGKQPGSEIAGEATERPRKRAAGRGPGVTQKGACET